MNLTADYEALVHLIARAFARTHGSEDTSAFADTVVEHAKAINEDDENGKPETDYVVKDESLPVNEHKDFLPPEVPKSEQQESIDTMQAEAENKHE